MCTLWPIECMGAGRGRHTATATASALALRRRKGSSASGGQEETLKEHQRYSNEKGKQYDGSDGRLFAKHVRLNHMRDFQEARSWSELKDRLSRGGLRLETRGSGLIITNGRHYAKLSSVSREFSRSKLEARLGPYEKEAARSGPEQDSQKGREIYENEKAKEKPGARDSSKRKGAARHLIPLNKKSRKRAERLFAEDGRSADDAVMNAAARSARRHIVRMLTREKDPLVRDVLEEMKKAQQYKETSVKRETIRQDIQVLTSKIKANEANVEKNAEAAEKARESLTAIYQEPEKAFSRLSELIKKEGPERASLIVHADPARLGRLKDERSGLGKLFSGSWLEKKAFAAGSAARMVGSARTVLPAEEVIMMKAELSRLQKQLEALPGRGPRLKVQEKLALLTSEQANRLMKALPASLRRMLARARETERG